MTQSTDILDLTKDELRDALRKEGRPAYRADQILAWVYKKKAGAFDAMTDLPAPMREELAGRWLIGTAEALDTRRSDDGTVKILVGLSDGETVESVGLPRAAGPDKLTACLSTQAGCRWACPFCVSGRDGLSRDLRPGEIVQQALLIAAAFPQRRLSHVVVMGVGEPLDNYEATLAAVRTINADWGLGIGARRITISTCGVVPGIRRLAGEGIQVGLAVSLHAATDELRDRLVPANRKWPLAELLAACADYAGSTGRQVTFEYVLLPGVNSGAEDAQRVVRLLGGMECSVNVIACNPGEGQASPAASDEALSDFAEVLRGGGLVATVRRARGLSVDGACGQLRAGRLDRPTP